MHKSQRPPPISGRIRLIHDFFCWLAHIRPYQADTNRIRRSLIHDSYISLIPDQCSPGSWPLIARGRERVAGLAAKRTFTIPCPWPLNPQVVNELPWVAAKRTFTVPGPWPLCFHGRCRTPLGTPRRNPSHEGAPRRAAAAHHTDHMWRRCILSSPTFVTGRFPT